MDPVYYILIAVGVLYVFALLMFFLPKGKEKMTLKKWYKLREERHDNDLMDKECFKKVCGLIEQASNVQFYVVGNKKSPQDRFKTSDIVELLEKRYDFLKFEISGEDKHEMIKWSVKEELLTDNKNK